MWYGPRGAWAPQPCGARAEEGTGGRSGIRCGARAPHALSSSLSVLQTQLTYCTTQVNSYINALP